MAKKKHITKQLYGRTYTRYKTGFKSKPNAEQFLVKNQNLWTLKGKIPRHIHITNETSGWTIYFSPKKGK